MRQLACISKYLIMHNLLKDFQSQRAKFLRDTCTPVSSHPQGATLGLISLGQQESKQSLSLKMTPSVVIKASNEEGESKARDTNPKDKEG